ncbi:MAG: hypothetical protein V1703_01960 [Candidatus Altiarchaeota archaeon]
MAARKAQSSLEFLMTYSWAFILLAIVVVVAWRWGVFSLSETIAPGNYGFWGVTPADFKMDTGGQLTLSLTNGVGANVTVNYVEAIGVSNVTVDSIANGGVIEPGKRTVVQIAGLGGGDSGGRFEVFIVINYSNSRMQPDRERLSSGTIWGSYE